MFFYSFFSSFHLISLLSHWSTIINSFIFENVSDEYTAMVLNQMVWLVFYSVHSISIWNIMDPRFNGTFKNYCRTNKAHKCSRPIHFIRMFFLSNLYTYISRNSVKCLSYDQYKFSEKYQIFIVLLQILPEKKKWKGFGSWTQRNGSKSKIAASNWK